MRIRFLSLWLVLGLLGSAVQAQVAQPAFVPEDGFWWASDQSGRGFAIEQQDDQLFVTFYGYTNETDATLRTPLWLMAYGSWSPPRSGDRNPVYIFDSPLYRSDEGQCIGCAWVDPVTTDTGLDLSITFESPWRGTMELGPETIDIERFWYSSSISDATNVMLGQWKVVRDYTEANDDDFPFEADVLVFDERRRRNGSPYVEGYQATTGNNASGAFNIDENFYVIVVEETQNLYLAYYTYGNRFGSDRFNAYAERFRPGDELTFRGFPAEGFRAANRSFVDREITQQAKIGVANIRATSSADVSSSSETARVASTTMVVSKTAQQQQIQLTVDSLLSSMLKKNQ